MPKPSTPLPRQARDAKSPFRRSRRQRLLAATGGALALAVARAEPGGVVYEDGIW